MYTILTHLTIVSLSLVVLFWVLGGHLVASCFLHRPHITPFNGSTGQPWSRAHGMSEKHEAKRKRNRELQGRIREKKGK
jgi:hypothetical protein